MELKPSVIPSVVIMTGLMASGKSSVAQAIAERLPMSVHLRGDLFRKMVINGRMDVTPNAGPEAEKQLLLRYMLARDACAAYAGAGFTVIYQDVILGRHLLETCAALAPWAPGVVVLAPNLEVVAERDRKRAKTAYGGSWTPQTLAKALAETPDVGLRLDTSDLTVGETVEAIFARADETRRNVEGAAELG